jgi:Flp pilus assembly pilin Flp
MTNFMNQVRRAAGRPTLVKDDRGLSTVEYVIILVLIAAAAVGTWKGLGKTIKSKISDSNTEINTVDKTNGDPQ